MEVVEPKVEAQEPAPAPAVDAPPVEKLYAGKFKTVEELEKSYIEANRTMGSLKSSQKTGDALSLADAVADDDQAEIKDSFDMIARAGLDPSEVAATILKDGDLSPQQYEAIQKKYRVPKGLIKEVASVRAQEFQRAAKQAESEVLGVLGGREGFVEAARWAKANLTEEHFNRLNTLLQNPQTATSAAYELAARRQSSKSRFDGSAPGAAASGVAGFASADEFRAASNRLADDMINHRPVDKNLVARIAATETKYRA